MEMYDPYELNKESIDDEHVRISTSLSLCPFQKLDYLNKQILRCKSRMDFKVDSYLTKMRERKPIQFYKCQNTERGINYVVGPYFTMGLEYVDQLTELVIKNHAHHVPFYVFTCRPDKVSEYMRNCGIGKALVRKRSLQEHFEERKIKAGSFFVVPPNSVYFLYAVTHSSFLLERRGISSSSQSQGSGYNLRNCNTSGEPRNGTGRSPGVEASFPWPSGSRFNVEDLRERNDQLNEENMALRVRIQQERNIREQVVEGVSLIQSGEQIIKNALLE